MINLYTLYVFVYFGMVATVYTIYVNVFKLFRSNWVMFFFPICLGIRILGSCKNSKEPVYGWIFFCSEYNESETTIITQGKSSLLDVLTFTLNHCKFIFLYMSWTFEESKVFIVIIRVMIIWKLEVLPMNIIKNFVFSNLRVGMGKVLSSFGRRETAGEMRIIVIAMDIRIPFGRFLYLPLLVGFILYFVQDFCIFIFFISI